MDGEGSAGGVDVDISRAGQGGLQVVGCITRAHPVQAGIHFSSIGIEILQSFMTM